MFGPSKKITSDSGELPTQPVPLSAANSVDVTGKSAFAAAVRLVNRVCCGDVVHRARPDRSSTVWSRTGSVVVCVTLVWMRDFQ